MVFLGEQEVERVGDDVLHVHLVPEDLPQVIVHHVARDEEPVARAVAEVRPVEDDPDGPAGPAGSLPQQAEALRAAAGGEHG